MVIRNHTYSDAIREGFGFLLDNYPEVFVVGQGLWSPWYVGDTMKDLDKIYGKHRIIDTPVSEAACTGAAVGAALSGMKPIVVHPRMDFALYAMDPIVNQAAKWNHMMGGQASAGLTIRAIINRGGQQGAQHSQSLHTWFAHVPGLRVVMPATANDARDLLIASALNPDPVVYIDDRWLYQNTEEYREPKILNLAQEGPRILKNGNDLTIVGSGYSTHLANLMHEKLSSEGISPEVIDLRILNPFDASLIIESVKKTKKLVVIDGGTKTAGFAAEVMASVSEELSKSSTSFKVMRLTLPDAPAPSSGELEKYYYPDVEYIYKKVLDFL
jgi:pyruvate dehydrogenase E1 component beta subunit